MSMMNKSAMLAQNRVGLAATVHQPGARRGR
jgi:hypothetical protein